MKLAILAQSYLFDKTSTINGTLVQLHNLAFGFVKNNVEVHYITVTKDIIKSNYEFKDGIHFHWIQSNKGFFEWKRVMPIYMKILKTISPDAVYVRGRNVMQYVAGMYSKENHIPYVWGTNGEDSAEFWKNVRRLKTVKKSILRKIALFPLKASEDFYINKGMKMANLIVNQSIEQKIETKKNLGKEGVVLPSYFYLPSQEETSKDNLILWLANLSKGKQPELFIDIIDKIDLIHWKVILAGGSNIATYEKSIRELAKNKSIETVGRIDFKDSFKYYNQAKIYINTSKPHADGLPNAYIQSWLSGTIVLSLHHDPNKWMEKYNIGFCSYGDEEKLISKLQEFMASPETITQMSNNARKFAESEFSNDKIIQTYKNLFKGNAKRN
ncbi:glycosyltransferase family 4 protein [Xanthomarina spongicola]|uniref:Glycosyltransferase involved in cell wall biosynthesis n=1 Tax=Xanthomarina spongicola TaxID=570520 RepID=A0A316DIL2_9FLAO|nr:glycosyltransferase family 4 protein [Xanthomarina spongicola]PWK18004.1 glycosyltransferase involved in cell wall biosynthesis [Xanthomarina spongicola]